MKTDNLEAQPGALPVDSRDFDFRYTEETYRALIDQAPDAIFIADHKLRVIDVNARGCEMSGYSREEVLRKSIFDFMVPDEVVVNPLNLDDLQKGKTVVAERRLKRKDGTIVPVEVTSKQLSDGRLQAIVRDISQRKRAEREHKKLDAALRQSEQRFRALIEHGQDAIALFGADGTVLYASPSTTRVLGYQPEELLQRNMVEFIRPDDLEAVRESLAESLRQPGVGIPAESYVRHKDGGYRFLEGTFTNLLNEPSVGAIVNNYRDVTERKRAEDARGELSRLLEESLNEIYVFDAQTLRFIQVNQGARHNLGYALDELRALTPRDLKPEFDAPTFEQLLQPLRTNEKSKIVFVTKHRRKDDSLYDVEVHVQMARLEGRSVFVAIILDTTERKQAEEALHETDARLRLSIEAANVGLWDWNLKTNQVYYSPEWKSQIGYQNDEISNDFSEWESRVHPDDIESTLATTRQFIANPQGQYEVEFRFRHKDGSYRWINTHANVLRDADGMPERMLGSHIDVTERKQAEAALRESEERFAKAFRSSPMAVSLSTLDEGRFIDVNDAFLRMFGFQRDDVVDRTSTELKMWFDPVDRAELAAVLQERGRFQNAERRFPRHDGQVGWALCAAELVELKGKPCVVSLFNDITERKEAEAAVRESEEQYRALSARLLAAREEEGTRIAREIHDELGGVLTGLKWDIEECEKVLSASTNAEPLGLIRKKIPVMTGLLDNTIDTVRRISSELRPGVLDDLGLVAAIEWQAQQFQQRTGIECPFKSGVETIDLNRDQATAIFRVFQEVLTNVIRHAQATRVEIKIQANGEFVLEVKDNGRGISESERQNTRSLGLLGMHERVQLIGGQIEISGAKGKGTRVVVRVPLG